MQIFIIRQKFTFSSEGWANINKIVVLVFSYLFAIIIYNSININFCDIRRFPLSKLDYCNVLYNALPTYLIKRLQRVQNAAASFVQGRYTNTENVLDIRWLPVKERIALSIAKFTFKSLHFDNWPSYLSVHVK